MLKYRLILFVVSILLVDAEWVEMPQFSDDSKVYKLSVNSHQTFYNKFSNKFENISGEILEAATVYPSKESLDDGDDDEVNIFNVDSDAYIIPSEADPSTTPVPVTLELPIEENSATTTSSILEKSQERKECRNETIEGLKFQDYLPMEILTEVHRTLKSQPSTLKGKIIFLKKFERDLMGEIEARLATALSPPRRTRGAHDYYDHEDEMGFPSLEGALMAISFLTFAVYLVRLVMLLFRNANTTTTSNAATIFFGRNRRSTETLNNKTEEILKYLNSFEGNL